MIATDSGINSLTLRERDCLRLLAGGLSTGEAAVRLGVSASTLNKHLANIREKLAVSRTAHALILYHQEVAQEPDALVRLPAAADSSADDSAFLSDFLSALFPCVTFDEAWTVLKATLALVGIEHLNFGIVAEPPGRHTNGARTLKMDLPDFIPQMYEAVGGVKVDPFIRYVVCATKPLHVENKLELPKLQGRVPQSVFALGEALVDYDCNHMIIAPYRDDWTEAPLALVFMPPSHGAEDYLDESAPKRALLRILGYLFVHFVQARRLLADVPRLSNRQKEALGFAARGFNVDESAEQMGVSKRFVEKTLAAARQRLGAPTTASAVFRATAYRTLA